VFAGLSCRMYDMMVERVVGRDALKAELHAGRPGRSRIVASIRVSHCAGVQVF